MRDDSSKVYRVNKNKSESAERGNIKVVKYKVYKIII